MDEADGVNGASGTGTPVTPDTPSTPNTPSTPDEQRTIKVSKYLSRHLRHSPERIGLAPDEAGWVEIDVLMAAASAHGFAFTSAELDHVVRANDKQRFAVEGTRIRARQGHSIPVDLGLSPTPPPGVLYHGTVARHLAAIRAEGLRPMNRHDVHLSADRETATRVGARRGRPVILTVDAPAMHADGHTFRVTANGVWLTAEVPPRYVRFSQPH
ncbi:RNA 2'-phosphotransferase [Streptomyces sp. NA04227]|nr:RNA 2'-phosphotransferase [Streptomyces sp. NA04227]